MRRIGSEVQYQFWCITICTLSALGCSTQIGDGDSSNTAPLAASSRHATFKTLVANKFVVAVNGGGGAVDASGDVAGAFGTFTLTDLNGGDLQDGDSIQLAANNGQFVVAENGGGGAVNANRAAAAAWETFIIHRIAGGGVINNGDQIALQTQVTHTYLSALNGGGGTVVADRTVVRTWETFVISIDGVAPPGGPTDAGIDAAPPAPLVWPNDAHAANSDPWIAQHHDDITEMHPRALLINFANNRTAASVTDRWKLMSDAMSEGSRYHGYSDPAAKPFVIHQLVKLVDLTDNPVPSGWTFPNSTKMPRLNGGIDFAQLYNQKYADYYAIPDPKNPAHNLTLCEMLQKGVINELFIVFNKTGADGNVPEIIEYKQTYDANDVAIPGRFEPWAGNGAFDPPDLPAAKACGVSLRVDFLEMTGGISGAMHVLSHNFEHIGDSAVPNHKKFYHPLMNRDFDKRFNTPFADWYGITVNGSMTNFITYNGNNSVTWTCPSDTGCAGKSGTMNPFDQGCGNTHYAANSRNSYDMANAATVLTRCEHYGLHDGPGGKDLQTPFNASTWGQYGQKYGNDGNGGGWQIYLFQSFPGYHNKATLPDGTKIKNFWPYLYY